MPSFYVGVLNDTVQNLERMKNDPNLDIFKDDADPAQNYMPIDYNKLKKFISIQI